MTFDTFITKWKGKPVDFDGVYPNQCMDLMHQYAYDVLGITDKTVLAASAAYLAYTNFRWPDLFTKTDNTPDNFPKRGDILFFGTGVGQWGHVCIVTTADVNDFESFDANWPTGSLPHIEQHTYKNVLGWLTYKPQVSVAEKLKKELDEMRASRDKWKADYKALVMVYEKEVADLMIHRDLLQKDLAEANAKIEELKKAIMTNKTPLSAYTVKERFDSIVKSLFVGGDINA